MTEEQLEEYRKQIVDANNVRAVLNSKGWKETCLPMIMSMREQFILNGKAGYDPSSQTFTAADPNAPAKALWTINGIDSVLQLFATLDNAGKMAKKLIEESDTSE